MIIPILLVIITVESMALLFAYSLVGKLLLMCRERRKMCDEAAAGWEKARKDSTRSLELMASMRGIIETRDKFPEALKDRIQKELDKRRGAQV